MSPTTLLKCPCARLMVLLLVCLGVAACSPTNKKVTKENLAKIKAGMTEKEVEAILGRGEDDAEGLGLAEGSGVAGGAGIGGDLSSMAKPRSTTKWLKWGTDEKYIRVGFDNGKVTQNKIQSKGL